MKLDLSKLPVGEAVIGFLIIALIITFILAFQNIDDDDDGEAVNDVTPTPADGATPPPGGTEIIMGDNFFDPNELTATVGESVTYTLINEGAAIHNMVIQDPAGDVVSDPDVVRGGQTATLTWTPAEAGEVPFICEFHPTQMTGTITVQ